MPYTHLTPRNALVSPDKQATIEERTNGYDQCSQTMSYAEKGRACRPLGDQPPRAEVASIHFCSSGTDLGRSKKKWRVERSTGVVPVSLHRGSTSSVGLSIAVQASH